MHIVVHICVVMTNVTSFHPCCILHMWKSISKCFCECDLAFARVNIILQVTMWKSILKGVCKHLFAGAYMKCFFCKCSNHFGNMDAKIIFKMPMDVNISWKQTFVKIILQLHIWKSFWKCKYKNHCSVCTDIKEDKA